MTFLSEFIYYTLKSEMTIVPTAKNRASGKTQEN
jgi:hypothetical protein